MTIALADGGRAMRDAAAGPTTGATTSPAPSVVMIAVDASVDSTRAASGAIRLFGATATYLAVSVADVRMDPMPDWQRHWGVPFPVAHGAVWTFRSPTPDCDGEPARTHADAGDASTGRDATTAGLDGAESLAELGDPVEAIVRAAEAHDVDVIVVGAGDRSWVDRLLRRSVCHRVIDRAATPVLVVH